MLRWRLLVLAAMFPAAAQQPSAGALDIYITSGGKPAAARIYVWDANGRPLLIPGAVTYSLGEESHSVIDQTATALLPPGKYRVRAEKGMEFQTAEKTAAVIPGEAARVDLEVSRLYNMNGQGWYSGDLHIHRSPEDMPLLVRAEDLNVAPVITRHLGSGRDEGPPFLETHLRSVDQNHIVSFQNQEVERLGKGHGAILLLNTRRAIDSNMAPLFPLDRDFAREARAQGGFVDAEKPIWKSVPVNLAFGLVDSVGVVNSHFHPHGVLLEAEKYGSMEREGAIYRGAAGFAQWMMDLYYSFLNCGFRLAVSAGSASGIMPSWPGYERTYVHLSGPFSYEQWFRDLQSGRSIATNGPLLEVYMNGQPPGAAVDWEAPAGVTLAIDAHAQERLDRVEIVYNGEVIRSFSAGGNTVFRTALNLTITEPGWLAVRCFEPVRETVRYAHTSPFYFLREGKLPVKRPAALRWAEYIRRLAASARPADYPSADAYEMARSVFQDAEAFYRRLAE
jgi:hypothetical protein